MIAEAALATVIGMRRASALAASGVAAVHAHGTARPGWTRERADKIEPTLAAEPIENAEASEPTEPTDRIEPAEPMDRIEPDEPIDRIDPLDPMLKMEPENPGKREDPAEIRITTFWQPGQHMGISG